MFISDTKRSYQNAYCNCAEKYEVQPWCAKWSNNTKKLFCILNGGLASKYCPGARRLRLDGQQLDDYFTSNPTICTRGERKLSYQNR